MYLTFDIGTSSVKGALVGEDGRTSRVERSPVGLYRGVGDAAWEAEPAEWWAALSECAGRLVPGAPGKIRAVAVSGNGPTLVPVDVRGDPVGRAISWMDRRARDQADRISALLGFPLDPSFYLPKALWFLEHRGRTSSARPASSPAPSGRPSVSAGRPAPTWPTRITNAIPGAARPPRGWVSRRPCSRPTSDPAGCWAGFSRKRPGRPGSPRGPPSCLPFRISWPPCWAPGPWNPE
ncbi:MAG: FGGY family carbohydrate kinase [Desulfobacterales bacterium]|nr:FGGY family carbohydrate kinase [Desulfobacterales bacterium]